MIKVLRFSHLAPGQADRLGGVKLESVIFANQMSLTGSRTMPYAKGNYDFSIVLDDSHLMWTIANDFRSQF